MFCSAKPNQTFRLQNNTIYRLPFIQLFTTFKKKHGEKMDTDISSVSVKLQINHKRSFYKAVSNFSCKISFIDLLN